jgi:aldehyde dehydrogenase (NAD+)
MQEHDIEQAFVGKRTFFDGGNTRSYQFRIEQLSTLRDAVKRHEADIVAALFADLHKSAYEAFSSEVGILYAEIGFAIKHLKRWMRPQRVGTPLMLQPSRSRVVAEPRGVVLIVAPWNYPFQLLMSPLVGAIAAGCCAVVKPSEYTPRTAAIVGRLVAEAFDPRYISVVQGDGAQVVPMLVEGHPFNHVFFTGSPRVGRRVMAMAAQHLTPVTLELGGKSPAIVHADANLRVSVRRLVWAKYFNAGQTCVAPDYLLVHRSVKDEVVALAKGCIGEFYGDDPERCADLTRIVNRRRFDTLMGYLADGRIAHGGRSNPDTLYIEPTLVEEVSLDAPIMQEEIFGPILPIIAYDSLDEALAIVRRNRYPLALYLFTQSKRVERFFVERVEFGGGAINNALLHLVSPKLPFGGVMASGMGRYHGRHSFDTFSHYKSILSTSTLVNLSFFFPPYTSAKLTLARWFMR